RAHAQASELDQQTRDDDQERETGEGRTRPLEPDGEQKLDHESVSGLLTSTSSRALARRSADGNSRAATEPDLLLQFIEQLLLIEAERAAMGDAIAEVRPRGLGVAESDVAFRQAQAIRRVFRKSLRDSLQQFEAGFRVAVTEQRGRGHHVQRPEQALGRAETKLRVELGAAPRVALDFGNQTGP